MTAAALPLAAGIAHDLAAISTATLTTVLLKKGLRNVWLRGARPLAASPRVVGRAFTLRFVPAREDLATPESWSAPISTRPPGKRTMIPGSARRRPRGSGLRCSRV